MAQIEAYMGKPKNNLDLLVWSFARLFDFTKFITPSKPEDSSQKDIDILRQDWEILNNDMWISFNMVKDGKASDAS
jgi:hypothetical protein